MRGVQGMLFHKVEALAQFERGADGLAVVFGDAEQAVDAVIAFGIFDAASTHQRGIYRLLRRENFDAVDIELAVLVGHTIGVNT